MSYRFNYPAGCSRHVSILSTSSISTTQCMLGQDRTGQQRMATLRPDGVRSIYKYKITWFSLVPAFFSPSSVKHQQSAGTPRETKISQIFHNFCRRGGGSKHTFFDAPVKCFDPIQGVLFRNSKCNFGIKVGEYSKDGNGCTLFSNQFFFLTKESKIKLII